MYGQSGLQASKFVLTLYCFAKSLMQIATPNSTFFPRDEDGDEERDGEEDFAPFLFLPCSVRTGVTATATRAAVVGRAAAVGAFETVATGTTFPEYGLWRTTE